MKNIIKTKKCKGGIIQVVAINSTKLDEVYYFDYADFAENVGDLVELLTGSTEYIVKKVLF